MALFQPEFEEVYPYTYRIGIMMYSFTQDILIPKNQVHTINPVITISGKDEEVVIEGIDSDNPEYPDGTWYDYWVITVNGTDIFRGRLEGNPNLIPLPDTGFYLVTTSPDRALYTGDIPPGISHPEGMKYVLWSSGGDRIWVRVPGANPDSKYVDEDSDKNWFLIDRSVTVTRNLPDVEFIRGVTSIVPPQQGIGIIKISSEADEQDKFRVNCTGYYSKLFRLEPGDYEIYIQSTDTYVTHTWYLDGKEQKYVSRTRVQTTTEKQKMKDVAYDLEMKMIIGYSSPRYSKHRKSNEL